MSTAVRARNSLSFREGHLLNFNVLPLNRRFLRCLIREDNLLYRLDIFHRLREVLIVRLLLLLHHRMGFSSVA